MAAWQLRSAEAAPSMLNCLINNRGYVVIATRQPMSTFSKCRCFSSTALEIHLQQNFVTPNADDQPCLTCRPASRFQAK